MIHVDLDKILTAKALQEHLGTILFDVEEKEELYVITKKGRPRAALINIDYLQELTGKDLSDVQEYDRYPAEPTPAGAPQGTTDIPPQAEIPPATIAPVAPVQPTQPAAPAQPPVEYPDLDIDNLEIPDEEPAPTETEEVVMPVPPVAPTPAQPVAPIPSIQNSQPTPDQAQPPVTPTPSQ